MKYDELDESILKFNESINLDGLRSFEILENENDIQNYVDSYIDIEQEENEICRVLQETLLKIGSIKVVDYNDEDEEYKYTVVFYENFNIYIEFLEEQYKYGGYDLVEKKVVEPKEITKIIYVDTEN
jgi:hypothetical protein